MPITPKPVVTTEQLAIRIAKEDLERLDAYVRFLGGATDRTYVVTEALRLILGRNKRFTKHYDERKASPNPATTPSSRSTN